MGCTKKNTKLIQNDGVFPAVSFSQARRFFPKMVRFIKPVAKGWELG